VTALVAAGGFLAQIAAWRRVRAGKATVWNAVVPSLAMSGLAALLARRPRLSRNVPPATAVRAGVISGVGLYAGTVAFTRLASHWRPFRVATEKAYAQQGSRSLPASLVLSLAFAVPGEELFWRGFVQGGSEESLGPTGAATLAWAGYIAVNAASGSLPIVAGGVVGGATWGGLSAWSRGVLAPLVSHLVWTGLMVARPPLPTRAAGTK
jgi:membrane protease YdiL (CAAX protease family)